jgi:hypothetical protein
MAWAGRIGMIANGWLIRAPHGAVLVNMIRDHPGSHIFENFSPATIDRGCFWDLSRNLGYTYSCFLGSFAAGSNASGDSDCSVDPEDLIACIAPCSRGIS